MAHNIRENDSMLVVGAKPWHGLGVTLAVPPNSVEEALRIATLDWNVCREPLFLRNGVCATVTGAVSRQNNGQYAAIVREDTQEILGIVGPNYTPYQNLQMADLFNPLIDEGLIDIETCGSLYNGRRVWMLAKYRNDNLVIEKGDEVRKYLTLAHGHDGTMAIRYGLNPIRIVCANTLSIAIQNKSSHFFRCLHTNNVEANLLMLRDSIKAADGVFEATADQFRLLAGRGVSRASLREYARILIEAPTDENCWTSCQVTKIGKIVGAALEGRGNSGRNWWHAYNGFTEYLTWEQGRSVEKRLDSNWFEKNADMNAKALGLALTMSM